MSVIVDAQWVISIFAAVVILLSGLGVIYLELPDQLNFEGLRTAKLMLAISCFLISAFLIALLLGFPPNTNPYTIRFTSLVIISIVTFLMANVLVLIVNPRALKSTHLFLQLALVILIFLVTTAVILSANTDLLKTFYRLLIGGYVIQLLVIARFIQKEVASYMNKAKNGNSPLHLNPKWIDNMFLYALSLGLASLVFNYFGTHKATSLVFIVIYTLFFLVVSLNFIRQGYRLKKLSQNSENTMRNLSDNLNEALNRWVKNKGYLKHGITLTEVATQIGTNRTYLSNHINTEKQKHFNCWINELRISEAKWLLINRKDLSIDHIGNMVGYSEQSNFTHHFTEITGTPPQKWRKIQMPENP